MKEFSNISNLDKEECIIYTEKHYLKRRYSFENNSKNDPYKKKDKKTR